MCHLESTVIRRRGYFLQRAQLWSHSLFHTAATKDRGASAVRGEGGERKVPPRHCNNCLPVESMPARTSLWRGNGRFAWTHGQTYARISALSAFANAKGNMQRSVTILYTSLLGMCLGSSASFPSNINIGENGARARNFRACCLVWPALPPQRVTWKSQFCAAQQEDCSPPTRTNMRCSGSPSRTTRTYPNWCRRWIWSKWGTASPWHTPVSRISQHSRSSHSPHQLCQLTRPFGWTLLRNSVVELFGGRKEFRKKKETETKTVSALIAHILDLLLFSGSI